MTSHLPLQVEKRFETETTHFRVCLSSRHGWVVCTTSGGIRVYSLENGSLVRSIGHEGDIHGVLPCRGSWGLCLTPDENSIIVCNSRSGEITQISLLNPAERTRLINLGREAFPEHVSCNRSILVIGCVTKDVYTTPLYGALDLKRFNASGPRDEGDVWKPKAMRRSDAIALIDGDTSITSSVRILELSPSGDFIRSLIKNDARLKHTSDFTEGFSPSTLITVSAATNSLTVFDTSSGAAVVDTTLVSGPYSLSEVSGERIAILESVDGRNRITVLRNCSLRMDFIDACVALAKRVHQVRD